MGKRQPSDKVQKKRQAAGAGPPPIVRLLRRIPPPLAVHGSIIVLVLVIGALGAVMISRYVEGSKDYHIRKLQLVDLPSWCPPDLVAQLQGVPSRLGRASIYDRTVNERVAALYRANPWVRRVVSVRKRFPGTLVVKLEVRQPRFAVERRGGRWVIDREAAVLPLQQGQWPQLTAGLRCIWGVKTPPPQPGQPWRDAALAGGIETLELLESRPKIVTQFGIAGVDVSNYGGAVDRNASDIDIVAANNCRIAWGRPPSTDKFGELPPERKLECLESVLQKYPQPRDMKLNVRFADAGGGIIPNKTVR